MKKWFSQNWLIVLSGLVIGAAAVTLTSLGNPGNMGFCIACFLRDISGALGLHSAPVVQYFRPEIVGIVLGALIAAIAAKEFKGHGGSSPVLRFVLGAFVMIGALMFLGCPLRMVIRLGGGDLNALVGLVGFIVGILVGIVFLKKGFSLQRSYRQMKAEGAAFPLVLVGLYVVYLLFKTAFKASEEGPGSMHAAIGVALAIGVIVGILCQRSRMCMVGFCWGGWYAAWGAAPGAGLPSDWGAACASGPCPSRSGVPHWVQNAASSFNCALHTGQFFIFDASYCSVFSSIMPSYAGINRNFLNNSPAAPGRGARR